MGLFGEKKNKGKEYVTTCAECRDQFQLSHIPRPGMVVYCDACKVRILKASKALQDKIKRF